MKLRSISDVHDLKGKRVLVRVDFNVPIVDGAVGGNEDWRLKKVLPTVELLVKRGARVILASHLGRPEGKKVAVLKLDPVAKRLSKLLGKPVKKLPDCVGAAVAKAVDAMKDGQVVLLENLRFNKGEEDNDAKFAAKLAALADLYVNDSFATCHREAASLVAVVRELPAYAGLLLETEIESLGRLLGHPKKPFLVVMGGAKVADKIGVIERLLKASDRVLLGGALVIPFLKSKGYGVGASKYRPEDLKAAAKTLATKEAIHLLLPRDLIVGSVKKKSQRPRIVDLTSEPSELCDETEAIYDIGPKTVSAYASYIRSAKTLVWNGPLGWFEIPKYSHGTLALGRLIAARSRGTAFGVVGGGESVRALQLTGLMDCVDHVSTGGGAMLEFLEGKTLPGLEALTKSHGRK
jgi:phosphoglycerate kinase